jgi:4-amino-4-deoxy-L-arabinose transferase-like glycosyltransferase
MAALLLLYLWLAVGYLLREPFGAGPDEMGHYLYIETLANTHRLPIFRTDPAAPGSQDFEAHQPPLYYLLHTPFYAALSVPTRAAGGRGLALVSILLGGLTLGISYRLFKLLTPTSPAVYIGATALMGFLPMFVYLNSRLNNDHLCNLLFAAALWLFAKTLRDGLSLGRSLGAGLILGAALLTKNLAVLLLPLATLTVGLAAWREPRRVRTFLLHCGIVWGVALLLAGWWFVRNVHLYGDPLAEQAFNARFLRDRWTPGKFLERGVTPGGYWFLVLTWIFASFWGVFGHMDAFMDWWLYLLFGAFSLAALIGLGRLYARLRSPLAKGGIGGVEGFWTWPRPMGLVLGVGMFGVIVMLLRFNTVYFQAQARYLFPLLPGFALSLVLGLTRLVPPRFRLWPIAALLATLLLANGLSLGVYVDRPYPREPGPMDTNRPQK